MYLVTGTALGELNHPNPLEPQKFKKRSRHRNVKRKKRNKNKRTIERKKQRIINILKS